MVYASLEKTIGKFRNAETGPKSHLLADFSGLLLITFTYTTPDAARPRNSHVHAPSDDQTTCAPHPAAPHGAQLLHFSMCCVQWRQQQPDANALFRKLDQAWQDASPLQRRLAVATATTLRRPPRPLRRTGAAQHHLSPMRASSAKRDNAGGERARARRKAARCRCRKASLLAPPAWFLAK